MTTKNWTLEGKNRTLMRKLKIVEIIKNRQKSSDVIYGCFLMISNDFVAVLFRNSSNRVLNFFFSTKFPSFLDLDSGTILKHCHLTSFQYLKHYFNPVFTLGAQQ